MLSLARHEMPIGLDLLLERNSRCWSGMLCETIKWMMGMAGKIFTTTPESTSGIR